MKGSIAAAGMLFVLGSAGQALAADQFDLICTGTSRFISDGETRPVNLRIRVDLVAGQYCLGDCTSVEKLLGVTESRLTLRESETYRPGTYGGRETIRTWIDRQTGRYEHSMVHQGRYTTTGLQSQATCERAPFSGFPEKRF